MQITLDQLVPDRLFGFIGEMVMLVYRENDVFY